MVKIIFVTDNGSIHEAHGDIDASVMECAVKNSIPGIIAECGGACTCATCHVYVDDKWVATVGGPADMEADMLDFADQVRPNSRLSCQIKIKASYDGLVLHIPTP
jgi:2Fe-2S ferredoxin